MSNDDQSESPPPTETTIKRGAVVSVNIYEIQEHELQEFENGGESSVKLAFWTFLYSIAFSSVVVLITFDFKDRDRLYVSFFAVSFIGIVMGTYLFIEWLRCRRSVKTKCKEIRARIRV